MNRRAEGGAVRMRGIVAVLAAGALFAGAAPALAGGNLTVKPNPVKQGKTLKVIASNCVSGPGYTAYVRMWINERGEAEHTTKKVFRQADASGTTKIAVKMKPKRWQPDRYNISLRCMHEFDSGGKDGLAWDAVRAFRVK